MKDMLINMMVTMMPLMKPLMYAAIIAVALGVFFAVARYAFKAKACPMVKQLNLVPFGPDPIDLHAPT